MEMSLSLLVLVLLIDFGFTTILQPSDIKLSVILPVPVKPLKEVFVGSEDSKATHNEHRYTTQGITTIGQPPYINLSELPVPGKPLQKGYIGREDSRVTFYEYKYTPQRYSLTILGSDSRYHNATGTLTDINGTKMYIEEGEFSFSEIQPEQKTCRVKYIIDETDTGTTIELCLTSPKRF